MPTQRVRVVVVLAVALVTALAGADQARAAGAVFIDACQTLSVPNTTYKLTKDLTSCGNCLVVGADKITIDLQGHSITNTGCPGSNAAITDGGIPFEVITVKNGTVIGYDIGVDLATSTRVSVLGVTAKDNGLAGIVVGPQGLVKSSEASGSSVGIFVDGDRGQVQQCNVHGNRRGIFATGNNCLITMNTANNNDRDPEFLGEGIRITGNKCTVSYNTTSHIFVVPGSVRYGIRALGTGHLFTRNVALNNRVFDFQISCPSTVTYNESTNGFPASYNLVDPGCHTVNND